MRSAGAARTGRRPRAARHDRAVADAFAVPDRRREDLHRLGHELHEERLIARDLRKEAIHGATPPDRKVREQALDDLVEQRPLERERAARGEKGRALAERYFDIAAAMPRWYGVYEDALRNRRS